MFEKIEAELLKDAELWCTETLKAINDYTKKNQIIGSGAVVALTGRVDALDCAIRNRIQKTTDARYINTMMKVHFSLHQDKPSDADIEFHANLLKERLLARYLETLSELHSLKHYEATTSIDMIYKYKTYVADKYRALRDDFVLSTDEVELKRKQITDYVTSQLRAMKTNFNKELVEHVQTTKWSALSAGVPATVQSLVSLAANTSTAPIEQTYPQVKSTIEQNASAFPLTKTLSTASFYNNEKQRLDQLCEREKKLNILLAEYNALLTSNQSNILVPVHQFKSLQQAEADQRPALELA